MTSRLSPWTWTLVLVLWLCRHGAWAADAHPLVDRAFFAALDPACKGTAEARKLGTANPPDLDAATAALAAYYRSRKFPAFSSEVKESAPGAADRVVAGRIGNRTFPKGEVAWGTDVDMRSICFGDLAAAWTKSKKGVYLKTFSRLLRSWVAQVPCPGHKVEHEHWSTLETAVRMGRFWPDAFQAFVTAPQWSDGDLVLMIASMLEQAAFLDKYHSTGSNWLVNEGLGIYSVGLLFPEFTPAKAWRKSALSYLETELAREVLADGAWSELAPGYGNWNSNNIVRALERAKACGRTEELPKGFTDKIAQTYTWPILMMAPDGRIPRLNDCGGWLNVEEVGIWRQPLFPENPILSWVAKQRKGAAPPFSQYLPASGFSVMRSGWDRDATYLCFQVGPMGSSWHAHQDKLQLLLWVGGREMLMDNGGGPYPVGPQRNYSRSADSHNTVLVDGGGQARVRNRGKEEDYEDVAAGPVNLVAGDPATPAPIFVSTTAVDYACAWYQDGFQPSRDGANGSDTAPRPAVHRREVAFLKPFTTVVVDTLTSRDGRPHAYEARWHLPITTWKEDATSHATTTLWSDGPNLAIVPLVNDGLTVFQDSKKLQPEVLGWTCEQGKWLPALTVRHRRDGPGTQRFVTLFQVLPPDTKPQEITVTKEQDGDLRANFTDGGTITVSGLGEAPGFRVACGGARGSQRATVGPPPKSRK